MTLEANGVIRDKVDINRDIRDIKILLFQYREDTEKRKELETQLELLLQERTTAINSSHKRTISVGDIRGTMRKAAEKATRLKIIGINND